VVYAERATRQLCKRLGGAENLEVENSARDSRSRKRSSGKGKSGENSRVKNMGVKKVELGVESAFRGNY